MQKNTDITVLPGSPAVLGVTKTEAGYNFAAAFDTDEEVRLLLYKKGQEEPSASFPIGRENFVGDVAAVLLSGFHASRYEYNYQVGEKVIQDPCAKRIVSKKPFGLMELPENPHQVRCGFDDRAFDWGEDVRPCHPYDETILYKLHLRGFTKEKHAKIRHKGTFLGLQEKIPYLKELGITAVELMPIYDFDEMILPGQLPLELVSKMKLEEKLKVNYWGYTKGNYYAPKPSYSAGKDALAEVRSMVKALHEAEIECIMEFYFPAGMNGMEVVNILRHWYLSYHMDGFHLIGDGVPVELICQDPLLRNAKLMFLNLWENPGGAKNRPFRNLAEYGEGFKQDMRRFLKSDEGSLGGAIFRTKRNPQAYAVINYLASQDGFTMMDMVSYDEKHNEANGEDNRDGNAYNYSWNCGVEGPSRKTSIKNLRLRQLRNAFLLLLLSQGTPMIYAGDEFGNSQDGNNNAYCQDNEIGWVDWRAYTRNQELLSFVKEMIAFRKQYKIFHQKEELRSKDYKFLGYPDFSCHSSKAWYTAEDHMTRYVGMMYCGDYVEESSDYMYVAYNFHWEPHSFALPKLPDGREWFRILSSSDKNGICEPQQLKEQKSSEVKPRSIEIFIGKKVTKCTPGNTSKPSQDIK